MIGLTRNWGGGKSGKRGQRRPLDFFFLFPAHVITSPPAAVVSSLLLPRLWNVFMGVKRTPTSFCFLPLLPLTRRGRSRGGGGGGERITQHPKWKDVPLFGGGLLGDSKIWTFAPCLFCMTTWLNSTDASFKIEAVSLGSILLLQGVPVAPKKNANDDNLS